METLTKILELLADAPEVGLWGLGIYLLYMLLRAASWIGGIVIIGKLFIKRFFDAKEKALNVESGKSQTEFEVAKLEYETEILRSTDRDKTRAEKMEDGISKLFSGKVLAEKDLIRELAKAMRRDGEKYVHTADVENTIGFLELAKASGTTLKEVTESMKKMRTEA